MQTSESCGQYPSFYLRSIRDNNKIISCVHVFCNVVCEHSGRFSHSRLCGDLAAVIGALYIEMINLLDYRKPSGFAVSSQFLTCGKICFQCYTLHHRIQCVGIEFPVKTFVPDCKSERIQTIRKSLPSDIIIEYKHVRNYTNVKIIKNISIFCMFFF